MKNGKIGGILHYIGNQLTRKNGERVPEPCQITIGTAFGGGKT